MTGLLRFDEFDPGKVVIKFQQRVYRQNFDIRNQSSFLRITGRNANSSESQFFGFGGNEQNAANMTD